MSSVVAAVRDAASAVFGTENGALTLLAIEYASCTITGFFVNEMVLSIIYMHYTTYRVVRRRTLYSTL